MPYLILLQEVLDFTDELLGVPKFKFSVGLSQKMFFEELCADSSKSHGVFNNLAQSFDIRF